MATPDDFQTRFATLADTPGIVSLFNAPLGNKIKKKTPEDIEIAIGQRESVVRVGGTQIFSYAEIKILHDEDAIRSMFQEQYHYKYRHQRGDVVVYVCSFVNIVDLDVSWQDSFAAFCADQLGGQFRATHARGSRIVYTFGIMGDRQPVKDSFLRMLRGMAGQELFAMDLPEITVNGMRARGVVAWLDRSLTTCQKQRTQSNRYLITELEQRRLLGARIGIVGLSTGSVALEVLLREGVGGIYRLADFDLFELGNANRMLFGSEDVGKPKIDLCSARVSGVDPDVRVERFSSGVTPENVRDFVQDCDLIIEECDDIVAKVLVRKAAQQEKVPLLMATSQEGMLDVERYDVDVKCRPFHLTELPPALNRSFDQVKALTPQEKRDVIAALFAGVKLSSRFLESCDEIGLSISSWPQLAEEVMLNAASIAHVSRRILLGDAEIPSGRFSASMHQQFTVQNRMDICDPAAVQEIESAVATYVCGSRLATCFAPPPRF